MKKIAGILAVIVLLVGSGAWFWGFQKAGPEEMDSIIVAYSPFESTALFWIAEDRHFFEKNGIDITLREYDSGAASLDGVVNGEAEITVGVSEFPLVRKAFQNANISAIGNIDKGEFIYLVARQDRGITNVSDLKGKRVGTTIGTVAEFHLGRLLMLRGMTIQDITLVDVETPAGWVNAVADGEIDAISTAQPYANSARDRLGANAVVLPAQGSQPVFGLVVSTDDWIRDHPDIAARFLTALAQAEEDIHTHPAESRAIVQNRLNLDAGYMDTVWQQNQFTLSLDQSLITAMEGEARWMIANNLTNATTIPDFHAYVSTESLSSVKPASVNIIGIQ
ncbi:MAG: NitT/TauT family transport system substrate-binding protein [Methanoculleus sp.]|nr:NitT/TauT family transport system substrate-binding protein [Methanoculleus sp.]